MFGQRKQSSSPRAVSDQGFSLVELLCTLLVLGVIVVTLVLVLYSAQRSKASSTNRSEATYAARTALAMIAEDLRSAGFGTDISYTTPQPPIAYVDSVQVLINSNELPYPDTLSAFKTPPQAYNPTGSPRPQPLNASAWTPPIKYRTGAEVIRYTLDVNNDGVVNAADLSDPVSADAARTPNPNDYVLIRQVYGDSVSFVAGNNGGTAERVALVGMPGGSSPPMFQVYLRGSSTPWNWSSGAVPPAQLSNIERIVVNVTSTSGKPDSRGIYATATATGEVNSMRNTPNFGEPEYAIDGYVFDDVNTNGTKNGGEAGLAGVTVRLGNANIGYTNASGYYMIHARAGTYTLRHTAPAGYGAFNTPDSFVVTIPPAISKSFADTVKTGGWVYATVYNDKDNSHSKDAGEPWMPGVKVTLSPSGASGYSDANGSVVLFCPPGAYSLSVTAPDTMTVSTTNPVSGSMSNGGTASWSFGLYNAPLGTVSGHVFRDNNRNANKDAGETGVGHVWVGVTPDNGLTILGYQYTDSTGGYSIDVPANDPPGTTPYSIMCIVPDGYFATGSTAFNGVFVKDGDLIKNKDFGIAGYQIITLNASRVLSLATADLIENDWNGNHTENAHQDVDLVLGADAGGVDNVSVWFNQYDSSPLYSTNPTNPNGYTRTAPQSVLTLSLDTLDTNGDKARPDMVTGTKKAAGGNFFIWLNQNGGGNEGYFTTSFSTGLGYTTQDGGDVQSVLTYDCAGGNMPDIIVGTKSILSPNNGTLEVWQSSNAVTPTFSRQEVYPSSGAIPGGSMGEVTSMALADLNNDGLRDLIVGTRTGNYTGELLVFKMSSKVNGNRFHCMQKYSVSGAVTSIVATDMNSDGYLDVIVGTQTGTSSGQLQYFRHDQNLSTLSMTLLRIVNAPGIVMSMSAVDLGGGTRKDIAVGWRANESNYLGGVEVYYTDLGFLPSSGSDPSGGAVYNMCPALTSGNFNYGVKPSSPAPPFLMDFAAGLKSGVSTGALVIFIR